LVKENGLKKERFWSIPNKDLGEFVGFLSKVFFNLENF
jgi:hypothetical protein